MFLLAAWPTPTHAQGPVPLPDHPDWVSEEILENGTPAPLCNVWGDLDADGDLDMVAGHVGGRGLLLLQNQGLDAQGRLAMSAQFVDVGGWFASGCDLGDLDRDGDLDLVVGMAFGADQIFANQGLAADGTINLVRVWTETTQPAQPDITTGVALSDMDQDGDLDLVIGAMDCRCNDSNQPGTTLVYRNDTSPGGTISMSLAHEYPDPFGRGASDVGWLDVDQDRYPELAIGGEQYLRFYANRSGTLETTPVLTIPGNDIYFDGGDVDNNGYEDVVVGNGWGPNRLYLNQGGVIQTESGPASSFAAGHRTSSLAWGDVDGDGDLDLAAGDEESSTKVYLNTGGQLETTPAWESTIVSPWSVRLAWVDVDGDGDLDLAYAGNGVAVMIYLNTGAGLPATASVTSPPKAVNAFDLAWGDVDNDGRLELAAGNVQNATGNNSAPALWWDDGWSGARNLLYRLEQGQLVPHPAWNPTAISATTSLAWGDVNGDGYLDLAVGNKPAVSPDTGQVVNNGWNEIYLNQGGTLPAAPDIILGSGDETTTGLAWGDVNGDGRLDLAVANYADVDKIYLNRDGRLQEPPDWQSTEATFTLDLAWGDIDGDGDLDLVTGGGPGRWFQAPDDRIRVYDNNGGQLPSSPTYSFTSENFYSLALGDLDRDGDLDLAVGANGSPNKIYLAEAGFLQPQPAWASADANQRTVVAWGDANGDGFLDLAAGNAPKFGGGAQNKIYTNRQGMLDRVAAWVSTDLSRTYSLAWGDADRDGRLDLAAGNGSLFLNEPNQDALYLNQAQRDASEPAVSIGMFSQPAATFDGQRSTALAPADFYAVPAIRNSETIPISYTLSNASGEPFRSVRAFYSPDGGGQWFPAINSETQTNTVTATRLTAGEQIVAASSSVTGHIPARYAQEHVFEWDVWQSGFFGQSDNVVFRLEAYPSFLPTSNNVPAVSARTYPFRVRGAQIQVLSGTVPISGAMVYQLPGGEASGGQPMGSGAPFTTDVNGFLQGRGQIRAGDQLLALAPVPLPPAYRERYGSTLRLFYTNGQPLTTGVDTYIEQAGGIQQLVVTASHPLLLFDLDVALEWDASNDPAYLRQLEYDLRRASQHLYDFTNGQVALGDLIVNQNADLWAQSHILVHATNRLRPYATIGGIVLTDTADISPTLGITYGTGQVHMGATWNRYGNPAQSIGVDWPVILAHELGHYLLFLDDTYLGLKPFDGAEVLASVSGCRGSAMGDVYNINNTEFIADDAVWQRDCGDTLAAQELGRDEWTVITGWYPWLRAPGANSAFPGPNLMPFELTTVAIFDPITPANTLEDPTFSLDYFPNDVSSSEARAFLLRNQTGTDSGLDAYEYVYDLGNPVGGQNRVLARGAAPGDRLCVFDQARRQFGCRVIQPGDERLALKRDERWQPVVAITPVNSTTFNLTVTGVVTGLNLSARLYPEFGEAFTVTSLSPVGDGYAGTLVLEYPSLSGHVQLWVENDFSIPRRETIVAYSIGGNPGKDRSGGGKDRSGGGKDRSGGGKDRSGGGKDRSGGGKDRSGGANARGEGKAPAVSPDGQMTYFDRNYNLGEGQFYTVQDMAGLPELPAGKVAIGRGYNLMTTSPLAAPLVLTGSVSFQYRGTDVLVEERRETDLAIHFWDGAHWRALNTDVDITYNLASARSQGPGVYALLAGVTTPVISRVTPAAATSQTVQTIVIHGRDFLAPVRVALLGPAGVYTLPLRAASAVSLTAVVSPSLRPAEYGLRVSNGSQPAGASSATKPAAFALFAPAAGACFHDSFDSGAGQWTGGGSGDWAIAGLPDGGGVLTDSPAGPYKNAGDYQPGGHLTHTTGLTSAAFSLAGCANPVLRFRHAYQLAGGQDVARVELSADDGASWRELLRIERDGLSGAGCQENAGGPVGGLEWGGAAWRQVSCPLPASASGDSMRLRLSLTVDDDGLASKGWIIDDVEVR